MTWERAIFRGPLWFRSLGTESVGGPGVSKAPPGMEHLPWGHKLGDLLLDACTAKPWTPSTNTFDFQLSTSQLPASKPVGEKLLGA